MLPSALCLRPSPRCSLVFSIQGVLLSLTRSAGSQSPGSPRSAPSPQSPQLGAYAYLAESNPSFQPLCRYLTLALGCLGCLAVVERVVNFSPGPQRMQQHRQFPRHCHDRSLLRILPATLQIGTWLPGLPCGCRAGRKLPPWTTAHATAPPVSSPLPRSLASSHSSRHSSSWPVPRLVDRCPAPLCAAYSAPPVPTDCAIIRPRFW